LTVRGGFRPVGPFAGDGKGATTRSPQNESRNTGNRPWLQNREGTSTQRMVGMSDRCRSRRRIVAKCS
jgi:hypothetical protein